MCFWCNEKYAFGHKCKKKQLYTLQLQVDIGVDGDPMMDDDREVVEEEPNLLHLSLNAFNGSTGPRIMRLQGIHRGKPIFILIDSGSTHNIEC